MRALKIGDKIVIAALLLICVLSTVGVLAVDRGDNKRIVIEVDGEKVKEIALSSTSADKIYEFNFKDNVGYIEVKDGSVRMHEMDKEICPEGICSDTGWISKGYETIVCMPNKIVVSFVNSTDDLLDDVSG